MEEEKPEASGGEIGVSLIVVWDTSAGTCRIFQDGEIVRWLASAGEMEPIVAKQLVQQAVEYTYWYLAMWEANNGSPYPLWTVDYMLPVGGKILTVNVFLNEAAAEQELIRVGVNNQHDTNVYEDLFIQDMLGLKK